MWVVGYWLWDGSMWDVLDALAVVIAVRGTGTLGTTTGWVKQGEIQIQILSQNRNQSRSPYWKPFIYAHPTVMVIQTTQIGTDCKSIYLRNDFKITM